MRDNQSSKTAEAAAAIRAMHYLYEDQHIISDPYAQHFTNWKWKIILSNRFLPYLLKTTIMKPIYTAVGGQILTRSRYAEDKLRQAIANGIKQYVILGAGMDSFVLRHSDLKNQLTVFEIDHPGTQTTKRDRLLKLTGKLPENLVLVPVDFEKQTVAEALKQTIFNPDEPAFFSWIATTFYLTRKSIYETLMSIAGIAAKGSEIVFDYSIADTSLSPEGKAESVTTKKFVARRGEIYVSNFDHIEIKDEVSKLGYDLIEQATPNILHKLYFENRKDNLKEALWAAIIHFRVRGD